MAHATDTLAPGWLERARDAVNSDKSFRKRGSVDADVGLRVGDATYLVSFAGFSCHGSRAIGANELRDADFVIEMSPDQWQRFLAGRRAGAGRTIAEIDATDGVVKAVNPRKKLDFFRFHTSLQAFFDAGARA
jgi:hypothetical protein